MSQNALNLAFNNAAEPADRVVANGFAVTSETVGWLGCPNESLKPVLLPDGEIDWKPQQINLDPEKLRKAIGPIAFSSIYAWSLTNWGWNGHGLVFYILAAISV